MERDVAAQVAAEVAAEKAVIDRLKSSVVYPRFLGVDGSGDLVWELSSGRWTWGDDPYSAARKARTFEPERYCEKYGVPTPLVML